MSEHLFYLGDVIACLDKLPSESVDCVVTSPPYYGLRDYGTPGQLGQEKTVEEYVVNLVRVFREVRRVLKPSGTCWVNLGDSYARDAGVTFRGYGKHVVANSANVHGRNGRVPGAKPKDLLGVPWRVALALRDDGFYLRQDIIWAKSNPLPESVQDRPTRAHEYIFLLTVKEHYWYDAKAIMEPSTVYLTDKRYGPDGGGRDRRNEPWNQNAPYKPHSGFSSLDCSQGRNGRSVWTFPTASFPGAHFAVFPEELAERCIQAGCPPQVCSSCGMPYIREADGFLPACKCAGGGQPGTVLDPFGGSGTVTLVAMQHSRDSVYMDIKTEYLDLALKRCRFTEPKLVDCHEYEVIDTRPVLETDAVR